MRKEVRVILKWSIISLILGIATKLLLPLLINTNSNSIENVNNSDLIDNLITIISVGVTILTTLFIIIIRFHKLINLQLDNMLQDVPNIVKKIARTFGEEIISNIASTLSTLSENKKKHILWEFKTLQLNDFEKDCVNCQGRTTPHNCNRIIASVKRERRNRITRIANSLIFDNGVFFATETLLPSEIKKITDKYYDYYNAQKTFLKQHGIQKAHRFLIVQKDKLNTEITSNENEFKLFVDSNIAPNGGIPLSLKIITYKEDINDVFFIDNETISDFHDFVLAKKCKKIPIGKNKVTIFAQNANDELKFFNSEKGTHGVAIQRYNKWVDSMCQKTKETTANVSYSDNIINFQQIIDFNKEVQLIT